MTQLEEAMEIVKDLSQVKARLMEGDSNIKSLLAKPSDGTIIEADRYLLSMLKHDMLDVIATIDQFGAKR